MGHDGDADDAVLRQIDEITGDLDRLITTLGHPMCNEILERLRVRSPQTAAELASDIKASRSTIHRSVRRLVDARVIVKVTDGRGYVPTASRDSPSRSI